MKKIACQYVIVRFAPYVETGEFANVGILMIAPKQGYFGFKVETRSYKRVTRFFSELESKHYLETLQMFTKELQRVHEMLKSHGFDGRIDTNNVAFAQNLFSELVRPRENIVRFSKPRLVLTEEPESKLKDLFAFYIKRNFVTKDYKETILEKGVRKWLSQENIGERFKRKAVGNDQYKATFPFVEFEDNFPVKVIKPLNLAQANASKITDHGGAWLFRLGELRRLNVLPEKILFTVSGPETADKGRQQAFEEIVERLNQPGVDVTDYSNRDRVIKFARESVPVHIPC